MVLIGQESLKRLHWPLARIIQLYPGKDGLVRVAKVKTSSGDKIRPIQKLYNLEITPEIRCRDPLTERSPTKEVRLTTEEDPLTSQQEQHHIETPNVVSSYGRPIKRPNRLDLLNFSFPCLSRRDANSKVGEMLEKKPSEKANGRPAEAATGMQRCRRRKLSVQRQTSDNRSDIVVYDALSVAEMRVIQSDYFIGKRNVIYERAKFNRRSQGETEPVEEFITNLYVLAETCSYGILKEEMIRDRLVVGVKNLNLSEKLQLESELTLEKAIQIVRQSESVKNQQKEIRQDTEDRNVDVIDRKGSRNGTNVRKTRMKGTKTYNSNFPKNPQGCSSYEKRKCFRCGYYQGHSKEQCPAKDAICNKFRKKGHFAKVCHTKTVQEVSSSQNDVFIGIVEIVQK
ncbi:hypothetical protein LAZ67_8002294 [Cordylochernes scorpioides]|uniref:DUF5641 domain-containing protein n=1 Tax=Cordylochernes scorpioides TaxID=51811 RepID=A0ABY6KRJ0_9ARAC|nr:hypothetical protein LAZ67_8002294 [Cordylochernes scorpioides]